MELIKVDPISKPNVGVETIAITNDWEKLGRELWDFSFDEENEH